MTLDAARRVAQPKVRQKFLTAISPGEQEGPVSGALSVGLIETLSHELVSDRLQRLSRKDWPLVASPRPVGRPRGPSKRKFGAVGDAVVQVLAEGGGELRYIEVHGRVEKLLGGAVAKSSVENCLAKGSARTNPRLERVRHGR